MELTPELQAEFQKPANEQFGGQLATPEPTPLPYLPPEKQGIAGNFVDILTRSSTASFLQWQHDNIYNMDNPSFNLGQYLEENPDRKPYAHIFADAENAYYADRRWNRFKENQAADQRVNDSEAFWSRMAIDALTDPINLVPGMSMRRGVGIIEGIIRGGGSALPSMAVDQLIKSKYDPNFTFDNAKHEMIYGTLLFGALGGAVGMLRPNHGVQVLAKDMAAEARRLAGDGIEPTKPVDPLNPSPDGSVTILSSRPHDSSGSYAPFEVKETGETPTGYASAYGLERISAQQGPFARLVNSGYRVMEDLGNRLAGDYGTMFKRNQIGIATEPSAYLASEGWRVQAADVISELRRIHAAYLTEGLDSATVAGINVRSTMAGIADAGRKAFGMARSDGKMRFDQFLDEVFKAHKADSLSHDNKFVLEAAQAIRPFFDDILGAQLRSGYIRNAEWASRTKATLISERVRVLEEIRTLEGNKSPTANDSALLQHQREHIKKLDDELNRLDEVLSNSISNPTSSFKTADGKTYTINAETGVPTEGGPQRIIYLAYPYNELISSFPKRGGRLVVDDNGTLTLFIKKEGQWVADPSQRKIPYSTTPEVGMVPIELSVKKTETSSVISGKFEGYGKVGIGEKITEIGPVNQNYAKFTGPEKFYLPRMFIPEQVAAKEAELRKMMTDWYSNPENNPNGTPMPEKIKERVDAEINAMMQQTVTGERAPEGGLGRAFFTRQRSNEIPNELYANLGVIDTDIAHVIQMYSHRAGIGIEYTRAFGTPDGELALSRSLAQVARESKGKTAESILKEMQNLADEFANLRDGMLGTAFNNPDAIGKREANIIKAWFALTSMGRAIFSSLGETVRPMWVLGIKENFSFALNALGNTDLIKKGLGEQRQMAADMHELALGLTYRRHQEGGVDAGFSLNKYNQALDQIEGPLSFLSRVPLYVANGVGILTHYQKAYTGLVASHIMINKIKNVAEGVHTPKELEFLASYGISMEDAKAMAKMPLETDRGINFANTANWSDRDLARKFYDSVTGIQRRVINTAGPADKPAIMMGILGKGADRRDASLLSVPFQLRTWSMAATNKILLSGLQGRDASFMSGSLMMFGASYLMMDLKTPDKVWKDMGMDERILSSLEHSGIFGWYGDMPHTLEQLTQDKFGVRPALGMKPKFGQMSDDYTTTGELLGPGPTKMIDLYKAFSSPSATSRDKSRAVVNSIPFNNMIWIPRTWRTMAMQAIE